MQMKLLVKHTVLWTYKVSTFRTKKEHFKNTMGEINFNEKPNRVIKNSTGYKPKNLGSVLESKYVWLNQ